MDENRANQVKEASARQELLESMEEHKRLEMEQKLERRGVILLFISDLSINIKISALEIFLMI